MSRPSTTFMVLNHESPRTAWDGEQHASAEVALAELRDAESKPTEHGTGWYAAECRPIVGPGAVYIAGPMTGLPEFNYPAFQAVAAELRSRGVEVKSPTEVSADEPPLDYTEEKPYGYYLRRSLRLLLDCDEVVLLPGWETSRGARLECEVAKALGMTVTNWEQSERWAADR